MTAWDRPPFEVWRLEPGDVIRLEGHFPPVITVTGTGGARGGCDRIWWAAGASYGELNLPRNLEVRLLATQDPRRQIWVIPLDS